MLFFVVVQIVCQSEKMHQKQKLTLLFVLFMTKTAQKSQIVHSYFHCFRSFFR